jgi:anaerobic dimethyl sulfoxide reductase subunit B (iron-sulfur subunit)
MSKLGFYYDMTRCIGCRVCQIACKDRLGLEDAGNRTRRVDTYETGEYPNASRYHMSIACNHCEKPACVENCPTGAMFKSKDGTVLHDDNVCIKCEICVEACPYGAPQYVEKADLIIKCDSCKALREADIKPVCVEACMMRALDFGNLDRLKAKYGKNLVSELPVIGDAALTVPNILIKASEAAAEEEFKDIIL